MVETSPVVTDSQVRFALAARRSAAFGVMIVLSAFGGLGAWAAFAPLAGAIIAPGVVKVDSNRKTVQHLEGGIVKRILVRDGDYVVAGQTLIMLEDEAIKASLDLLQNRLVAEVVKAARLKAEREGHSRLTLPERLARRVNTPKVAKILRAETRLFDVTRRTLNERIALLNHQIEHAEQEIEGLAAESRAEQSAAGLLSQELGANQALLKRHYTAKVHVMGLKRSLQDYRARHGRHQVAVARTRQRIGELKLRIADLRNQYAQAAVDELTVTNTRILDLEERLRPIRNAATRLAIAAPIGGKVVDLKIFTEGGVIGPGAPLLDIVPEHDPLIVEARVGVDDISSVAPGLPADVRLTAYPTRKTPLLAGEVTYVSADQLSDPNTPPHYIARISVDPKSLTKAGDIALYPGMRAEVFVKTGERTALDYLLAPITASFDRALREP